MLLESRTCTRLAETAMRLIGLILITATSINATPFVIEDKEYRLPENCKPSNYSLNLSFPLDVIKGQADDYKGNVTIFFSCSTSTSTIRLHASKEFINVISISVDDDEIESKEYTIDEDTDILKINTPKLLSAGSTGKLFLSFDGKVSDNHVGLYRKSYSTNGQLQYFLTTKFEAVYARTMFPCFDEPSFRATFNVTITHPNLVKVYFNTKGATITGDNGYFTDIFEPTPPMSTYLLAFMLSDFDTTQVSGTFSVISRPGTENLVKYATDMGPKLLEELDTFTGYDYENMMKKLDALVVPDYVISGMEHWGMISFDESYWSYDENNDSVLKEEAVTTIMAHEFAHQWFGDLVSINWWSENYLKEGLAQYFQYFITHQIRPEWEMDKLFVLDIVHLSMAQDKNNYVKSLNSEVRSPLEVNTKLGDLTYEKGATIFNMVKHIMGEDNFKNGIRQYILGNQYKGVTAKNLWDALQDNTYRDVSNIPADLNEVMKNWVGLPGYPVIHVQRKGNDVVLSQQRFTRSNEDKTSKWYVPITYTVSSHQSKFRSTTPAAWLTPEKDLLIPLVDDWQWIILNTNVTGYYRVDYEESIWIGIKEALTKKNFEGIPELNRAQIVDDIFTFAEDEIIAYSKTFWMLEFLSNDTSYYSWKPALDHYQKLLGNVYVNCTLRDHITSELLKMTEKLYNSVPLTTLNDNDHAHVRKQLLAVEWACKLGNEKCISEIQKMFNDYKENNIRPNKNLKALIYCNGIRYSNDPTDWEFLWKIYKDVNFSSDKQAALDAFGCASDEEMLNSYLLKFLEDKNAKGDDLKWLLEKSIYNGPEIVNVALNFILKNAQKLVRKFESKQTWRILLLEAADYLMTDDQIEKLEEFKNRGGLHHKKVGRLSLVDVDIVDEAIAQIRRNMDWLKQHRGDLEQYFHINKESGCISLYINIGFYIFCILSIQLL